MFPELRDFVCRIVAIAEARPSFTRKLEMALLFLANGLSCAAFSARESSRDINVARAADGRRGHRKNGKSHVIFDDG